MRPRVRDMLPGRGDRSGQLYENVMQFARLLRRAGVPVGPAHVIKALDAMGAVGVMQKADVYWSLHASFITKREHHKLFDEAFRMFWRDPFGVNEAISIILPSSKVPERENDKPSVARRLSEAWRDHHAPPEQLPNQQEEERIELDAVMTFSPEETFRNKDFDQMTADEVREAEMLIKKMRMPFTKVPTRRLEVNPRGHRVDLRGTLRRSLRDGGHSVELAFKAPRFKPPPLVVLCDVSGSMERYSRMFVHLLHAITNCRDRVTSFLFGTRLTNVTRSLRHKDIDVALERLGTEVTDWSGGTRIATSLRAFNRRWSRRVLSQNAHVLLITDGLDRDLDESLEFEAQRLRKSCARLTWLNPLLRYEDFEPRARGVQTLLCYSDDFRPMHNLQSFRDLVAALASPVRRTRFDEWGASTHVAAVNNGEIV
ncbi:MAG: VWA domain-containing protein [Myxococcota bacterium]